MDEKLQLSDHEPRKRGKLPRWLNALLVIVLTGCNVGASAKSATIGSEQDVKVKVDSLSTIIAEQNLYKLLMIISAENPTANVQTGRMLIDDIATPADDQIPVGFSIEPGTTDNMQIEQGIDRYMEGVVKLVELNGANCLKSPQIKDAWICPPQE